MSSKDKKAREIDISTETGLEELKAALGLSNLQEQIKETMKAHDEALLQKILVAVRQQQINQTPPAPAQNTEQPPALGIIADIGKTIKEAIAPTPPDPNTELTNRVLGLAFKQMELGQEYMYRQIYGKPKDASS